MPVATPPSRRRSATLVAWRLVPTPMGPFVLAQDELGRLTTGWQRAGWPAEGHSATRARARMDVLGDLAERFEAYFAGDDVEFDDVPLPDGTEFQRRCWAAARRIPRGRTLSYAELARRGGGDPSAARAAGQCMRNNPLPIVVPCHRVIATSGALRGFGGATAPEGRELGLKAWLLDLEGAAWRHSAQRGVLA